MQPEDRVGDGFLLCDPYIQLSEHDGKSLVESFMPPEKAELTKPKEIKKWTDD